MSHTSLPTINPYEEALEQLTALKQAKKRSQTAYDAYGTLINLLEDNTAALNTEDDGDLAYLAIHWHMDEVATLLIRQWLARFPVSAPHQDPTNHPAVISLYHHGARGLTSQSRTYTLLELALHFHCNRPSSW